MNDSATWLVLLGLGAAHGVNPAMGWLFAVGLGLQKRDRGAVWRALGPLALGHALAIASIVVIAAMLGLLVPVQSLRLLTAVLLVAGGVFHIVRHRHPRFGGMRMSARDLTIWSFLMASAHGAGLMVLPFVLRATDVHAHGAHALHAGTSASQSMALTATLIHAAGYLIVTGVLAVAVYERVGLRILRTAWFNLNLFWAIALIATGLLTLVL
ncbi:MAG TPA: hypothetical protein VFZ04_09880 [Longimicrobiales bacterium]